MHGRRLLLGASKEAFTSVWRRRAHSQVWSGNIYRPFSKADGAPPSLQIFAWNLIQEDTIPRPFRGGSHPLHHIMFWWPRSPMVVTYSVRSITAPLITGSAIFATYALALMLFKVFVLAPPLTSSLEAPRCSD